MDPQSGVVIAVDPGKVSGWAVFVDGQLHAAGSFDGDFHPYLGKTPVPQYRGPIHLVVELPHQGAGKADKGDIIRLSVRAGMVIAAMGYPERTEIPANEWKGTVPKDMHGRRILDALLVPERLVLDRAGFLKNHNVIDAVGLGLWKLRRMQRGGGGA